MSNGTGPLELIAPNNQFVHLGLHNYCCDGRVGVVFPAVHVVVGFKGIIPGLNISWIKMVQFAKSVCVLLTLLCASLLAQIQLNLVQLINHLHLLTSLSQKIFILLAWQLFRVSLTPQSSKAFIALARKTIYSQHSMVQPMNYTGNFWTGGVGIIIFFLCFNNFLQSRNKIFISHNCQVHSSICSGNGCWL